MKKISFLLFAILATSALAKETTTVASTKLDETVISTENFGMSVLETPKNVTVITAEDIEKSGAQDIVEAVRAVPGMYLSGTGGQDFKTDILFRGQVPGKSGQNILVLVDGSSINSTTDTGDFNLNLVPIDTVERIEIVPNGGNVLYGEGAVAGVINIITKEAQNKKYYGQVGADAGNYTRNYKVNFGSKITDRFAVEATYLDKLTDGYKHHSERDIEYVEVKSKYKFDNGNLTLSYSNGEVNSKFSGAVDKKDKRKSNSTTEAKETLDVFKLKYDTKLTNNLEFMVNGDYKHRKYSSTSEKDKKVNGITIKQRVPSTDRDTKTYYINPQIKYNYWDKSYLVLGGDFSKGESDYQSQSHTSTGSKTTNTFTNRKSIGGFVINNLKYDDFQFTQGFRHQRIEYDLENRNAPSKSFDHTFNAQAYELTGTYFANDTSSIFLSYNRAFRAPTAGEAGSWNTIHSNLDIQTSDTIELGGKTLWNNFYLSSSIFHSKTEKEIFYLTKASGEQSSNYNFPDPILRTGVEIATEQYFDKLTLKQSFSYTHHEIDGGKYDGKKVPGLPNIMASIGFNYELIDNLNINTTLFYRGSSYAQYDYHNKLGKQGGYSEVNLNVNYTLENGLTLFGGVNNLFDKEYYYAKAGTSKDTLSYYAGNRRSYFVGFKYNF